MKIKENPTIWLAPNENKERDLENPRYRFSQKYFDLNGEVQIIQFEMPVEEFFERMNIIKK